VIASVIRSCAPEAGIGNRIGVLTSPNTLTSDERCWLAVTTTCGSIARFLMR
jgi:hypothetical protein